jgi:hypothetical protein
MPAPLALLLDSQPIASMQHMLRIDGVQPLAGFVKGPKSAAPAQVKVAVHELCQGCHISSFQGHPAAHVTSSAVIIPFALLFTPYTCHQAHQAHPLWPQPGTLPTVTASPPCTIVWVKHVLLHWFATLLQLNT